MTGSRHIVKLYLYRPEQALRAPWCEGSYDF